MERGMGRIVVPQVIIAALTAIAFLFIVGRPAGISSLLASLCFLIPNSIFVMFFYSRLTCGQSSSMALFGSLELIKIILITVSAGLVFWIYPDLHWIAFLASFVICLASYIFLLSKLKG